MSEFGKQLDDLEKADDHAHKDGNLKDPAVLLEWLKDQVKGHGVEVTNLTTSWSNGMALCALIYHFHPKFIPDFKKLSPKDFIANNELAFSVAEERLGISRMLKPKDMNEPDTLTLLSYLSQFHDLLLKAKPASFSRDKEEVELTMSKKDVASFTPKEIGASVSSERIGRSLTKKWLLRQKNPPSSTERSWNTKRGHAFIEPPVVELSPKGTLEQQRRFRDAQREMSRLERQYDELEEVGTQLEQALRDAQDTVEEETMMKSWLNLVEEKNELVRKTTELNLSMRELEQEGRQYEIHQRQRVCEKVLKTKSLITIITVIFNYLGLPRSGKTSFRRRITGEIENILKARQRGEVDQPSTGVLEDGGQVIIKPSCVQTGVIRSKVWSVIKGLGDEANMLNHFFHQIVPISDSKAATEEETQTSTHRAQSKNSKWSYFWSLWESIFASDVEQAAKPPSLSDHEKAVTHDVQDDEMFSIIREAMSTDHWEEVKYLLEDTILLINNDTGGHAEFLDLQAALVQGPSFNLLFSRLVDDMNSLFKIYYTNEEGRSTDKEDSTMTVEEVLFQSLSSIACFSEAYGASSGETQQSQSIAMFVGTHLDMNSSKMI